MNFIALESPRKLRGAFYTPPDLAAFLVGWIASCRPESVLEPCCGDGEFLEQLQVHSTRLPNLRRIVACEIDPQEAASARSRIRLPVEMHEGDFLQWYLDHGKDHETFDAVIGNPPFIRYQYLSDPQQARAHNVFRDLNLRFSRHTNAWVPFVTASLRLLRPGGRLAMVVPSEILHIPHAQSLRQFLADHCRRILLMDPEEIWFGDTLQGTVLLLAEKQVIGSPRRAEVAITPIRSRNALMTSADDFIQSASYAAVPDGGHKWMSLLLSTAERGLLKTLREHPDVATFARVASVDVGIVTGANDFFLVNDHTVAEFELQSRAHPMFGRSEHVIGLRYTPHDHAANKAAGRPANFLWFQADDHHRLPPPARRYLEAGMARCLHTRFKCRIRRPWYRVPSVYGAPIAMLKRAHHFPRLVLNEAGAYTTDTAYRITTLCPAIDAPSLVLGFVNSLTCLAAELEGRHYGGGVLELVPSEIERLLIPTVRFTQDELCLADQEFRGWDGDPRFVERNDERVLSRLRLEPTSRSVLHHAWLRLRNRRHRRGFQPDRHST